MRWSAAPEPHAKAETRGVGRPQWVSSLGGRALTKASLGAMAVCVLAAALEGLLAGRGVKRRLAELRQPPHSPPFAVWLGVGLFYYLICFTILSRLLSPTPSPLRWAALALLGVLLIGNALWNLLFFRLKNLEASALFSVAYLALALVLTILLGLVDRVSSWVFLPYLVYLGYATWWSLSLRRLNREERGEVA
jgi:benzodiazapine receptor